MMNTHNGGTGAFRLQSGLLHIIGYAAVVLVPVGLAAFLQPTSEGFVYQLGRNFALLGFMILILQVLLAARIKWIERYFGLDILIRFHKHMAVLAVSMLILHPLLLASGGAGWQLVIGLDTSWYIWLGRAAVLVLLANVAVSHFQFSLKLKFETWRKIHDVLGPAVIAGAFVHSWFAGHDLQAAAIRMLWILMLTLAAATFAYHRFIRPRRLRRRAWRVVDVHTETKDVWTVKLAPPKGQEIYDYLPGQFHFITFYRTKNLPVEEHHWTISSSPTQRGYVSSTIKQLGDFTRTIAQTRAGDRASVHGPFGRFSYTLHPGERDLVFVAGGIGITPLMSMLRHMRDSQDSRSVVLLYANRKEDQIVFRKELLEIESGKYPRIKVVHTLSNPAEGWEGETGHVNQEKIQQFCGRDLSAKTFYVCGPPGMLEAVIAALRGLGVSDRRIRVEIFSFLDR